MCKKIKSHVGEIEVMFGAWGSNEAKEYGIGNWSLAVFQGRGESPTKHTTQVLCPALRHMGVHRGYIPNTSGHDVYVVHPTAFRDEIHLGRNIIVYRDRSISSNGVFLNRGHSLVAGGIGSVIVATGGGHMAAAYVGKDSLIDRHALAGGKPRKFPSIVNAMVYAFARRVIPASEISMTMMFADVFTYGLGEEFSAPHNQLLLGFTKKHWPLSVELVDGDRAFSIDMGCLFESQAQEVDVGNIWTTYLAEFPELCGNGNRIDPKLIVAKRCS